MLNLSSHLLGSVTEHWTFNRHKLGTLSPWDTFKMTDNVNTEALLVLR